MFLSREGNALANKSQQKILLLIREDGPVEIKQVRAAKPFYDGVKKVLKDEFDQELEEMECKRGRKLIKYVDDELDWLEAFSEDKRGL